MAEIKTRYKARKAARLNGQPMSSRRSPFEVGEKMAKEAVKLLTQREIESNRMAERMMALAA